MIESNFRRYDPSTRPSVKELYRLNHRSQTMDFVVAKKREYLGLDKKVMGMWQALERVATIVDDSDPDLELPQVEHAFQTAEAIRADGHPRWFVLAGFIHDVGKLLSCFGEPQWAVVGDTFPVGCAFSPRIVYPELFADNPDLRVPAYQTQLGIYQQGCGLHKVHLSWGHDEYLYHVVKDHLPDEALYMVRYHSFYAAHREGEYGQLMDAHDREMFRWVRAFNRYDLYSKAPVPSDRVALDGYYRELVGEFFPRPLRW